MFKKGDMVKTPRFLNVKISEVFESQRAASREGFIESTHYNSQEYDILGKHIGENRMIFAAVKC